jgi:hypothetical protein
VVWCLHAAVCASFSRPADTDGLRFGERVHVRAFGASITEIAARFTTVIATENRTKRDKLS